MAQKNEVRALIFGISEHDSMKPLISVRPGLLLNVADKPIADHLIEHLVRLGIKKFDFVLHHFPEQVENRLGDGKRWGVEVNYHLLKDYQSPFSVVSSVVHGWKNHKVLIGMADTLPLFTKLENEENDNAFFYHYTPNEWSGWACVPTQKLLTIPSKTAFAELPKLISSKNIVNVSHFLNARSYEELVETNKNFLSQKNTVGIFPTTAKKVEPGVWISRGVTIEPGVKVIPPILIGEYSHIKTGALIGPNAIIENHCIIDNDSSVENSLICQNSYVGESLEVKNCIVDRSSLINFKYNSEINIKEDFILSGTFPPSFGKNAVYMIEKVLGAMLMLLFSPIYLFLKCTSKMTREPMLRLPSPKERGEWQTFDSLSFTSPKNGFFIKNFSWLPKLINIIQGDLHFAGTPPRSIQETEQLPSEWRHTYLETKPGLITLSSLENKSYLSEDDQYASDAIYAARNSLVFDIKMILKWFLKIMQRKSREA